MAKHKGMSRWKLSLIFVVIVFLIMVISMLLVVAISVLLYVFGKLNPPPAQIPLLSFTVVSVIVGAVIAAVFSRVPLKPIREVIAATDQLAAGDFSARIDIKGPREQTKLNASFNHMAEELGSVEMLRTDFVNNFSHEFKTPMVSISGFAKVLKRTDLTEEERNEYLDIIISETERLTELATNVLALSKIENQSILTDVTRFNLSEQIRQDVALLAGCWGDKHIDLVLDAEEIFIFGNKEMLSQVWINLIDNAIKFSPAYAQVRIQIQKIGDEAVVTVSDQGPGMSEENKKHVFERFYQADSSHTTKGNGLGLTIAQKLVVLHGGQIEIDSAENEGMVFRVSIPQDKQ